MTSMMASRICNLLMFFVFGSIAFLNAATVKAVFPAGTKLAGPYSPGVLAGDYLYVSGQGAKQPDGTYPQSAAGQLRQCLKNVETIVKEAGFSMDGLVYSQVYVRDHAAFGEVESAWSAYFAKGGPARSLIGVTILPDQTPVEVNAVVVRDPSQARKIFTAGGPKPVPDAVLTPERAYISDCRAPGAGTDVEEAPPAWITVTWSS
jgi:2-iminobutanoate/2-iminopropanoate deaminase